MKVLQWNIQWCRGLDGVVDPARIARRALGYGAPEVICLQEVAINYPALAGSSGEDQMAALAAALPGYTAVFAPAVDVPAEGGGRRQFGNAIFSRLPVRQVYRHSLPWPADEAVPNMPRVALEAVIETPFEAPFDRVRVTTTHLEYYSQSQRDAQVGRLRGLHAEACDHAHATPSTRYASGPFQPFARPQPALLTGDFNFPTGPADPHYQRLQDPLAPSVPRYVDAWRALKGAAPHAPTFCVHDRAHGDGPYCCDFVFVTEDLAPRLERIEIDGENRDSDHQPVLVEIL